MQFSEQLLAAVSQLEIKARRNVNSLLAGDYRTAFRGSGMQFKEFRHYEPGDDIRHMSWQVTARTGRATVKMYEEERELDVFLMVDTSGSSLFGTGTRRKLDMFAELVALMGLAAIRSGDNMGLLLFNEKPDRYLPPKRTREQAFAAASMVLQQPLLGKKSDLRPAISFMHNVVKHRSIVVVLSDFWVPKFDNELAALSKKHEVILLHCYDDAEIGMKLSGVHEACDPETGETFLVDYSSKKVRKALTAHHLDLSSRLESASYKACADYLKLSVQDDYLQRLVHFFRRRGPSRI